MRKALMLLALAAASVFGQVIINPQTSVTGGSTGVVSSSAPAHQFATGIDAFGVISYAAIVAGDVPDLSATYILTSRINAASGVAGLSAGSKITASQITEVLGITDLSDVASVTGSGTIVVFATSPTLTTPTLTSPTLSGTITIGDGAGNDKLSFVEESTDPACTAGDYFIWGNSTLGKLRKCENGVLSNIAPTTVAPPAFTPAAVVSGCGVEYTSGLSFTVGACTYEINGVTYTSAITTVTLSAADGSNPRIDAIIVDNTGVATKITGTPAATPAQPTVDAATQLQLTFAYVDTSATTPSNIAPVTIYDENTEWTSAVTSNINAASTSNPYHSSKDIEATSAVITNYVTLTKPASGTVDLTAYNNLLFYIRSKAAWPTGNGGGSNAARFLSIFWLSGSTQQGTQVVLRDGVFNFNSSITSAYQQVSIPLSQFGIANGQTVTTLKIQVSGNTGTAAIGFYIDSVSLQGGFGTTPLPTTLLNFKGTWSSTAAYVANDLVVSNGAGYIALAPSTNVAVTTTATWATLSPASGGCNLYTLTNNGSNWTVAVNGGTAVVGAAIAAATSQSVTIVAVGARQKVTGITLKTTTAWSGTGFTTFTMTTDDSVGGSAFYTSGVDQTGSYNLVTAVSNTNFADWVMFKSATFAGSNLQATITANQNLNANTITGVLAMNVCTVTLP